MQLQGNTKLLGASQSLHEEGALQSLYRVGAS